MILNFTYGLYNCSQAQIIYDKLQSIACLVNYIKHKEIILFTVMFSLNCSGLINQGSKKGCSHIHMTTCLLPCAVLGKVMNI